MGEETDLNSKYSPEVRTPKKCLIVPQSTSTGTDANGELSNSLELSTASESISGEVKDTALQIMHKVVNSLTPGKQVSLNTSSPGALENLSCISKEPALPPPASPLIRAYPIASPKIRTPLKSSTPAGKSQVGSPRFLVSPLPSGDCKRMLSSSVNEDNVLDTTNGSTAFSADESYIDV